MSDDDSGTKPRFRKKSRRVEVALARYYGVGQDEPQTIPEIASYLRVDETTVKEYINNSELGEEVEEHLAEAQARTRMEVVIDLKKHLYQINQLIEAKLAEKRPAVIGHRYQQVEGVVQMDKEGMKVTDEEPVSWRVPVPEEFTELPKIDDEIKAMWREKRQVIEQIRDVLGLDAPDKIESEHTEHIIEAKLLKGLDENPFPAAEVRDSATEDIGDDAVEITMNDESGDGEASR